MQKTRRSCALQSSPARRGETPAAAGSKASSAAKQCHPASSKATLKSAPRSDKMKVLALAGLAASASALLAPAAMPRALVARPAPTADATVLEVPRPRPLSFLCPSTWLLRLDSLTSYSVAPESKLESELKRARQRRLAMPPGKFTCIRGRVGLSSHDEPRRRWI